MGDDYVVFVFWFLVSFMYGFCMMEIDGSFCLNGFVDEVFEYLLCFYMLGFEGVKNFIFF